jgi:uncharacterized delta-60 repeat protein
MSGIGRARIVVAILFVAMFGLPGIGAVQQAAAQTIQVASATPSEADQGTFSLPVTIKGSGFKKGAKAKFYVAGTGDPGGITVSSTRFIDSTQLVATIDVASTATVSGFDIEVVNADGRTGKGTELFKVLEKVDPCTAVPEPAGGYGISDVPGLPGYLDGTFGNGVGRVIGPRHMEVAFAYGRGVAIDGAGRIVVTGLWYDPCAPKGSYELAVARYLSDGSLDSSFGVAGDGLVRIAFGGGTGSTGGGRTILLQPDGKIVIVGEGMPARRSNPMPVVVRLTQSGQLDTSFGTNGITWISPGTGYWGGYFNSATLQSDGKIVAAGMVMVTSVGQTRRGFIARLKSDGTLDTSFGSMGGMYVSAPPTTEFYAAGIGPEGRVVVTGYSDNTLSQGIGTIWRFTNSGTLDSTFGNAGVATIPSTYDADDFDCLDFTIDSAGYIVTTCSFGPYYRGRVGLVRYDPFGNLDVAFGNAGIALAPVEAGLASGRGVNIQGDGKIVVSGDLMVPDGAGGYAYSAGVWRFLADGSPDPAFGAGGRVFDPIASETGFLLSGGLAIQPDGKILWAGWVIRTGKTQVSYAALARFWQ